MARPRGPAARAAETRRRTVAAAYALFTERGYSVPLVEVARAAGVSVQNVYFSFGNKRTLALEALQLAVLGEGESQPPHRQAWFENLRSAPTPAAAIDVWVDNTVPIYGRVGPLAGMFQTEPELKAAWQHTEKLRYEGFAETMAIVAGKGRLRAGYDLAAATDVMFVLLSPMAHSEFVGRLGWSAERWGRWSSRTLATTLFESG